MRRLFLRCLCLRPRNTQARQGNPQRGLSALRGRVCVVEGSGLGFGSHTDPARGQGHRLQLGLQLRVNALLPGLLSFSGSFLVSSSHSSNKPLTADAHLDQASGAAHPACVGNSSGQHSC